MNPAANHLVMILLTLFVPGLSFLVWWLFRKRLRDINSHLRKPGAWRKDYENND